MLSQLDYQYCYFDNCFGSDANKGVYVVALFVAADKTILFYTSSVNCPGTDKNPAEGAQFDIQAYNFSSQQVNASNGHSHDCSAIEYRYANSGYFKFETISDIECMFGIAYSSLEQKNLDLSMSNMVRVELTRYGSELATMTNVFSGLIHVRDIDNITISNFCFQDNIFKTDFGDNPKIISRGTGGSNKNLNIKVILNDCFYDCTHNDVAINSDDNINNNVLTNCIEKIKTLNEIPQLILVECKGAVVPPPFTPIPNTNPFSKSDEYTQSNHFTRSFLKL